MTNVELVKRARRVTESNYFVTNLSGLAQDRDKADRGKNKRTSEVKSWGV